MNWEGAQIFQSQNDVLVESVDTTVEISRPIDLIVLDLAHEAIIVDDEYNSSNKDDSVDDKDGAK
jgi:hypothetical protein